MELELVTEDLPVGFDALRAEALAEGREFVERLAADWATHTNRFNREGEALLAAHVNDVLAGIGGLTIEPIMPGALRMRRFYVRASFRRGGVGRELASALLARARSANRAVTVNAAPESIAFWEALGFASDARDGYTHILNTDRTRDEPNGG
jgi:GNAT superfamily N-acetyltransferase